jgi:hypothetical protein
MVMFQRVLRKTEQFLWTPSKTPISMCTIALTAFPQARLTNTNLALAQTDGTVVVLMEK